MKKRRKLPFWLGIIVGIAACAAAIVICICVQKVVAVNNKDSSDYQEKAELILKYLDKYYLYDLDEEKLADYVATGILSGLDDRYSVYYDKEAYEELKESVSGEYSGIGVSIVTNDEGKIEVYKVFSGSPADEAGIRVMDCIIEADGRRDFADMDELVSLVRGIAGTTVDIVIERDGEEIPMTIERAVVAMDTIEYELLEGNIGYIYISEFDVVTAEQFNNALEDLADQGMESLIMDLRDNPGGDYDTVVAMCDRVLPEGTIMTVKDKNGTVKVETSDEENQLTLPMVVIINGNSASASEVFTGAIQDYGLATIVGEQSYGKGIVQSIFSLNDGTGLKFTTQEYYTPSGRSIHGVGITPDVEVSLPEDAYADGILEEDEDTQLQKAIEILSE